MYFFKKFIWFIYLLKPNTKSPVYEKSTFFLFDVIIGYPILKQLPNKKSDKYFFGMNNHITHKIGYFMQVIPLMSLKVSEDLK